MQCNRCGMVLQVGAPTCPRCGNPIAYNMSAPSHPQPPQGYPPQGQYPPQGPYPPQQGQYPLQQGYYPPQQPVYYPYMPPQKKSGGFCAGLGVGLLIVVICLCSFAAIWQKNEQDRKSQARATSVVEYQATSNVYLTPTPYSESSPPSRENFSGKAQSILTNAQIASELHEDKQPAKIKSIFQPNETVYLTFKLTPGNTGFAMAKTYFNGKEASTSKTIPLENRQGYGNFSISMYSEGEGAFELYWCANEYCGEKELAWVKPFSVK